MNTRTPQSSGTPHPYKPRQTLTRAEKFLARGARLVTEQKWEAARYAYQRALASDPDRCTKAFATVALDSIAAALTVRDSTEPGRAMAEYNRVSMENSKNIPPECLV